MVINEINTESLMISVGHMVAGRSLAQLLALFTNIGSRLFFALH